MGNVTVKTVLALPADAFLRKPVSTAHQQPFLPSSCSAVRLQTLSLTHWVGRSVGWTVIVNIVADSTWFPGQFL